MIHRYLDPDESLGELLFGLIMALTVTLGVRLLSSQDSAEAARAGDRADRLQRRLGHHRRGAVPAGLAVLPRPAQPLHPQAAQGVVADRGGRGDPRRIRPRRRSPGAGEGPCGLLRGDARRPEARPHRARPRPRATTSWRPLMIAILVSATAVPGAAADPAGRRRRRGACAWPMPCSSACCSPSATTGRAMSAPIPGAPAWSSSACVIVLVAISIALGG